VRAVTQNHPNQSLMNPRLETKQRRSLPSLLRVARRLSVAATLMLASATAAAQAPDAHYLAGVRYFQEGDYKKATDELKASIAAHPTSKAALYLSNVYLKIGNLGLAKDQLTLALKLEPSTPKKASIEALIRSIEGRSVSRLIVRSTPPGANIYLDSKGLGVQGTTPFEQSVLPGAHKVIAVIDGYEEVERDVTLEAGESTSIDLPLRTKGCDVSVNATPATTRATLDGAPPVPVPAALRVALGDHKLVVTNEKFEPKEFAIRCVGGAVPLTAALVPIAPGGYVTLPNDAGLVVTVDGRIVDATAATGVRLLVGRHVITITGPNRAPWTTTVDMTEDRTVAVAPPKTVRGFKAPALYLGVEGGANLVLANWNLGQNAFVAQSGTKNTPGTSGMAGLRIGAQVLPRLALEAEVHWLGLPSTYPFAMGLSYDANAVFHVFRGGWTPVVEGGLGVYQVVSAPKASNGTNLGTGEAFRGHLGIGYLARLNDRFSVRVDVRDVLSAGFSGPADNLEILGGAEVVLW